MQAQSGIVCRISSRTVVTAKGILQRANGRLQPGIGMQALGSFTLLHLRSLRLHSYPGSLHPCSASEAAWQTVSSYSGTRMQLLCQKNRTSFSAVFSQLHITRAVQAQARTHDVAVPESWLMHTESDLMRPQKQVCMTANTFGVMKP